MLGWMVEIVPIKLLDAMISRNKENSFWPLSVSFKGIHNGSCGNRKSVMVIGNKTSYSSRITC